MVGRVVRRSAIVSVGTYTPTLTNSTNVAASTAFLCRYVRVKGPTGDFVTVSGQVNIDPTAAAPTATTMKMSLPIASNFANAEECSGVFSSNNSGQNGTIQADTTNDVANFLYSASDTNNAAYGFTFSYQVI